ncbi:calcium-binding outer membrane-like protein [Fimbriimonas ginsengisoli Gsoil 348]|uniref:Calcium-binding outer membrane-like protein n=1 Tax=Fimbriimonas ginsengisoli Gsoil 348 TaxID=661478 RepID=A0A068NMT4_FIMGI|nr:calcium-binding outer membrane-like protein [Fimbriimonas ginsengisoli Gsoil 348]
MVFLLLLSLVLSLGCGGGGGGGGTNNPGGISISISPTTATVAPGATKSFTATVTGTESTGVSWSASGGSISNSGLFTAPAATGTYTVRATSVADPGVSAIATVTVATGDVVVAVTPAGTTLGLGQSRSFTATVTGVADQSVTWEASGGSITPTGFFTAPNTAGVYTITAHSVARPDVSGSTTVTVSGTELTVFVTPQNAVLGTTETIDFDAIVTNATNTNVTWSASQGTITSTGLYTAPSTAGTYTVTAKSVQDPTKSATVSVQVRAIVVTVSPTTTTMVTGTQRTFTATVTGPKNKAVAWTAPDGGTVTSAGLFTAPNSPGTYRVVVTSTADPRSSATATITVVAPTVKTYNFDTGIPADWTPTTKNETSPTGRIFLGRLSGSDTATLSLTGLTPHTSLRLTFDLFVIGDWENDLLNITFDGTSKFNYGFSNVTGKTQSYPDNAANAPGTGRLEANVLGYPFAGTILYKDTVYRITLTVPHSGTTAQIVFGAALTRTLANQSWGLDNVKLEALP